MKAQHKELVELLAKLRNQLNHSHNTVTQIRYVGPIG